MIIGLDQPLITKIKVISAFKHHIKFDNEILSYYFTKDTLEIVFETGVKINITYAELAEI